jgi:hypothetical protein
MALTALQRHVCRVLADQRKQSGESYVAGGGALNEVIAGARRSRDIDLFHDTDAALVATWAADQVALRGAGLTVETIRELPAFVEARVRDATETVLVQWVRDSAFRFFPLLDHELFGLTLHPFDLATNKLLAVVGRREARDWIDIVECHEKVQPLGYLAWAASGKDPGFSPAHVIEECARTRYVQSEIDSLDFQGPAPNAAAISSRWHAAIDQAREIVRLLPAENVGKCVLDNEGRLENVSPALLPEELAAGRVLFHEGRIRGAFPEVRVPVPPSR